MSESDGVVLLNVHHSHGGHYTPADPSRSYHVTVPLPRTVDQIIRKGPVKERQRRNVGSMSDRPQLKGVVPQIPCRSKRRHQGRIYSFGEGGP